MIKKILGILTVISAIVWLVFFINAVDQGEYFFIFLIVSTVNIILIVKTKFWKVNNGQKEEIKIIRLICLLTNIVLAFILFNIMKVEFDLDDSDDICIVIIMILAILAPFFYLLGIKKHYH
ncbi:hypothetical protein [Flavobacterium sp.]|uniref:hypothetical protein n=1 Tax=Flavobacterium sp. TaxID=239 RepID=UPI0032637243